MRVRRWDAYASEGRLDCDEPAALAAFALTILLELAAASFCRGTLIRLAAELDDERPVDDDVVVVVVAAAAVVVVVVETEA